MCGIAAVVSQSASPPAVLAAANSLLARRGPSCSHSQSLAVGAEASSRQCWLHLSGHVLHLRGNQGPTRQPHGSDDCALLFNGQIYRGLAGLSATSSDTQLLYQALAAASSLWKPECGGAAERELLDVFARLRGPFAIVWWHSAAQQLWFARDALGRRSLCVSYTVGVAELPDFKFALSSVVPQSAATSESAGEAQAPLTAAAAASQPPATALWHELPCAGVYCLDLRQADNHLCVRLFPWSYVDDAPAVEVGGSSPKAAGRVQPELIARCAEIFGDSLKIEAEPGLHWPLRPASIVRELADRHSAITETTLVDDLREQLLNAVKLRVATFVATTPSEAAESADGLVAKVPLTAVLFSGGVDSTVLAWLAHCALPPAQPIDLLNVAFENTRRQDYDKDQAYNVPDRLTGLASWQELMRLAPERDWRFVAVNVTQTELAERRPHIRELLRPLRTELDESLGCATWFAARGRGVLVSATNGSESDVDYQSTAPVLLLGSGADEQLGGYSRHRSAYGRGGLEALGREIAMDVGRLSYRNLGRDDRVVADHGKDGRYPFLDEEVINFLSSLPLECKMDMTLARGEGEKKLLRDLARQLNLHVCASLPKRAMQFGSRIAKMSNSKSKATDVFEE